MTAEKPAPGRCAILAVASSAGGIKALEVLLSGLGPEFPVPIVVVQHLDRRHPTVIADVLSRRTALRVKLAEADERIRPGTVYVAPPDRHLLVGPRGVLNLTSSELVHFLRPSADLLFESVAGAYGPQAIACVCSRGRARTARWGWVPSRRAADGYRAGPGRVQNSGGCRGRRW